VEPRDSNQESEDLWRAWERAGAHGPVWRTDRRPTARREKQKGRRQEEQRQDELRQTEQRKDTFAAVIATVVLGLLVGGGVWLVSSLADTGDGEESASVCAEMLELDRDFFAGQTGGPSDVRERLASLTADAEGTHLSPYANALLAAWDSGSSERFVEAIQEFRQAC